MAEDDSLECGLLLLLLQLMMMMVVMVMVMVNRLPAVVKRERENTVKTSSESAHTLLKKRKSTNGTSLKLKSPGVNREKERDRLRESVRATFSVNLSV